MAVGTYPRGTCKQVEEGLLGCHDQTYPRLGSKNGYMLPRHTASPKPSANGRLCCCSCLVCRNPDIATTLVGMCTCDIVRANIATTLEALNLSQEQSEGLAEHSSQQWRAECVVQEVQRILAPVKDATWPSGRPENN